MTDAESQDALYRAAAAEHRPVLERWARAYEADADQRRDLLQDMHFALWRSLARFDARCSLRTWVYRVAQNVAASHVLKRSRLRRDKFTTLDALAETAGSDTPETIVGERQVLARLMALIQMLKPTDRQVMLLYLEDLGAAEISEVTGCTPGAATVKIHRLKAVLARRIHHGGEA